MPPKNNIEGLSSPEELSADSPIEGLSAPSRLSSESYFDIDKSILPSGSPIDLTGRDILSGVTTGTGAEIGAGLGAPLGPVGAGLGAVAGGGLGYFLGDKGADVISGKPLEATGGDAAMATTQGVLNTAIPFFGKKIPGAVGSFFRNIDPVEKAISEKATNFLTGKNQLLRVLSPTVKEFDEFATRPVNEVVDEAIERGVFKDVSTPKDLVDKISANIGSKTKPNILGQQLANVADKINTIPASKVKYNELAKSFRSALDSTSQKLINPETGIPLTDTVGELQGEFVKQLSQIKHSITAPTEKLALPKEKALAAIQEQIKTYEKSPDAKQEVLNGLYSSANRLTEELAPLREKIANPDVSFNVLYQIQKTLDDNAKKAFDKETKALTKEGELNRTLANRTRELLKGQAQKVDEFLAGQRALQGLDLLPEERIGNQFIDLKHQYELFQDLKPLAIKAQRAATLSPLQAELGSPKTVQLSPIPIASRVPGLGRFAAYPQIVSRTPTARELFEQGAKSISDFQNLLGNATPNPLDGGLLAKGQRLVQHSALATGISAFMSVGEAQAQTVFTPLKTSPDAKNIQNVHDAVTDSIMIGVMKEQGLYDVAINSGVDQQTLTSLREQATAQAEELLKPINDAIKLYGEQSPEAMTALSSIVKTFPEGFEPPRSGIVGEVKVGSSRFLPNQEDQLRYRDKVRKMFREESIDASQAAEAINALNADSRVLLKAD